MEPAYEAPIEIPVVDQGVARPFAPSLDQGLAVAVSGSRLIGLGLREGADAVFRSDAVATTVGLGADYAVAFFLPQLRVLAHEEWHLAALREGGVTGTDRFLSGVVVDVSDEELIAFKAADPAGLVRAHSAGLEMQSAFVRQLADDQFAYAAAGPRLGPFEAGRTFQAPFAQAAELNTWEYLSLCASEKTDDVIEFVEGVEGGELERDFTGPDCTAWARDLLRPDEPYTARGPHGTGEGLGRSVGWTDLTPAERDLLKTQRALHLVDLVNPHLYGIDRVRLGSGYGTASLLHWLTPYGYAVDLHGGYRAEGPTVFGTVRLGISDGAVMPSLGAEVRDVALTRHLSVTGDASAWLQPRELRWGGAATPGGALSARLRWTAERSTSWIGVRLKSAGWEPGVAALDPAMYVNAGATFGLGRPRAVPTPAPPPAG